MELNKKQVKKINKEVENYIDKSYNLGKKHILDIFEQEVISGTEEGYIAMKYSCMLNLIRELRSELR